MATIVVKQIGSPIRRPAKQRATLAIMPRTAGVSSSVRWRCILFRPSPISVSR
jgi:hypothetical protein